MVDYHHEYKEWPFLNEEEFNLACAFFDQKYVRASLGPTRQVFKIRHRRALTVNTDYLDILKLIHPPENDDELLKAFERLGQGLVSSADTQMIDNENEDSVRHTRCGYARDVDCEQEALHPGFANQHDRPPPYSMHSTQPYVTYEIHLHPTYRVPTLWFTLHDLPTDESTFDIDSVYRYLVPSQYKDHMRTIGVVGGISAAVRIVFHILIFGLTMQQPHPLTDIPSFFIHPCQTSEALREFCCPLKDYILLWLGIVGGCVGLRVPLEMASAGHE